MDFNIDIAIVAGFLILTLVVGLYYGRGVRTVEDYALGGRSFSTEALVSTIVATVRYRKFVCSGRLKNIYPWII